MASSSNPPSSPMPSRIAKAIEKAQADCREIEEKWEIDIAARDSVLEGVREKHKAIAKLYKEIAKDEARAKEMTNNMPKYHEQLQEKWNFIEQLKSLYP